MPIEIRELHIRVVVQDTSEATLPGGALAVEGDTSQYPDHKTWIDVTAVNDTPTEEVSFAYAQVEVQHTAGGGGRDILIGGAGADHVDATNNRGHLLVGVDDVHLKVFDGFDLV